MADTKISGLTALSAVAVGDLVELVDISDTTMAASGTNKKVVYSDFQTLPKVTATASAGAATANGLAGTITSEALTTAAGADYTLTLTNTSVTATSVVTASLGNGTNTIAPIYVRLVTPAAGSVVIIVRNDHATLALNGTITISFVVL